MKKLNKKKSRKDHSRNLLLRVVCIAILIPIAVYVFINFILFPFIFLVTGSSISLAGVISSSMEHQMTAQNNNSYGLCGVTFTKEERKTLNFDGYWENCGGWYREGGISKEDFSKFPFKDGLNKGDLIVVLGRLEPKLGDVIMFNQNPGSSLPVVHRIIKIDEIQETMIVQTKGDHSKQQLHSSNSSKTDETYISQEDIIGKVIIRIPYLTYPRVWVKELIGI